MNFFVGHSTGASFQDHSSKASFVNHSSKASFIKKLCAEHQSKTELDLSESKYIYLQEIYVSCNSLKKIVIPRWIQELVKIDFTNNKLTELILPDTLINLEKVVVCRNLLRRVSIGSKLLKLRHLDLEKNKLTEISLPGSLINLEFLNLIDNPIRTWSIPRTYVNLKSLSSDHVPNCIDTLKSLEFGYFEKDEIKFESLKPDAS